jgi:hypothetical protein
MSKSAAKNVSVLFFAVRAVVVSVYLGHSFRTAFPDIHWAIEEMPGEGVSGWSPPGESLTLGSQRVKFPRNVIVQKAPLFFR